MKTLVLLMLTIPIMAISQSEIVLNTAEQQRINDLEERINKLEKQIHYFKENRQVGKGAQIAGMLIGGYGTYLKSKGKDNANDFIIGGTALLTVGFIFDFSAGFKLKSRKDLIVKNP